MELLSLNGRQACWAMSLAAFDFVVVYRPGKSNPADRPLRRPDYASVAKPLPSPLWQLRPLAMPYNQEGVSGLAHSECLESHPDLRKGNPQRSEDRGYTKENADIRRGAIATTAVIGVCRPSRLGLNPSARINVCRLPISRAQVPAASERKMVYAPESQDLVEVILLLQKGNAFLQQQWAAIAGLGNEKPTGAIKPWKIGRNGLLLYKDRVYIPSNPAIRAELLQRYHDDLLAGHFGINKTAALLRRKYHWIKMEDNV